MKLIAILTTLIGGLASVHAQHHVPAPATFNANINGGINSPTSSNIDIEGVATIIDKANDNTERKLHDMLTSVKDVMDEKFGLDLIDGLVLGGNGTRRLSKSHKSDKGIDIINEVLALVLIAVFLLVELFGYEGYDTSMLDGLLGGAGVEEEEDIADEITAAHHGHDGSSSKTAKSGGTDASAKTTKESKSVSCINLHLHSFFLSLVDVCIDNPNHTYPIKVKVRWWIYLLSWSDCSWLCYKWQSLL